MRSLGSDAVEDRHVAEQAKRHAEVMRQELERAEGHVAALERSRDELFRATSRRADQARGALSDFSVKTRLTLGYRKMLRNAWRVSREKNRRDVESEIHAA